MRDFLDSILNCDEQLENMFIINRPVKTEHHQHRRAEVVAHSSDHHQHLAADVVPLPLHAVPPPSLQWHRDEGDDAVSDCEVEHQCVNIGSHPGGVKRSVISGN